MWFANRLSNVKPFNDIWGRVVFRKDLVVGESQKQETMLCVGSAPKSLRVDIFCNTAAPD